MPLQLVSARSGSCPDTASKQRDANSVEAAPTRHSAVADAHLQLLLGCRRSARLVGDTSRGRTDIARERQAHERGEHDEEPHPDSVTRQQTRCESEGCGVGRRKSRARPWTRSLCSEGCLKLLRSGPRRSSASLRHRLEARRARAAFASSQPPERLDENARGRRDLDPATDRAHSTLAGALRPRASSSCPRLAVR